MAKGCGEGEAIVIGSDIGNLKSMLANVFTKAAEARDKAAGKGDAKGADDEAGKVASPKDPSDPAFLLSANLEDLTRPLRALADGAGDGARAGVDQADAALGQMQGMLEYNAAFADQLDQVMDAMGRDLGRMLKAFGLGDDDVDQAVKGFTGRFDDDHRKKAFGGLEGPAGEARPLAVSNAEHREATAVSVDVANIELTLEQGGKSLTLSFDRSSLSMAHVSESAYAATDGKTAVSGAERSAAALHAQSEGLTIRADGFSAEELDGIMGVLQKGMTGPSGALAGTLEGAATLTPKSAPKADGTMHLSLDLKGLLTTAFGDKGGQAAEAMGKEIRKQGFDVRI